MALVAASTLILLTWWARQRLNLPGVWIIPVSYLYAFALVYCAVLTIQPYCSAEGWMVTKVFSPRRSSSMAPSCASGRWPSPGKSCSSSRSATSFPARSQRLRLVRLRGCCSAGGNLRLWPRRASRASAISRTLREARDAASFVASLYKLVALLASSA